MCQRGSRKELGIVHWRRFRARHRRHEPHTSQRSERELRGPLRSALDKRSASPDSRCPATAKDMLGLSPCGSYAPSVA